MGRHAAEPDETPAPGVQPASERLLVVAMLIMFVVAELAWLLGLLFALVWLVG